MFVRKFYLRMLIEAAPFAVIGVVLVQMCFDYLEIGHDLAAAPFIILLPLVMAAAVTALTIFFAVHNTNLLRRYEYSLHGSTERIFYAVTSVIFTAAAGAALGFLLYKFLPFIDSKLAYAVKDAVIKNETLSAEREMIADLNSRAQTYRTLSCVSAGLTFILQAAAYILSARALVKVYRDPPDYWSGKKKGKGRR